MTKTTKLLLAGTILPALILAQPRRLGAIEGRITLAQAQPDAGPGGPDRRREREERREQRREQPDQRQDRREPSPDRAQREERQRPDRDDQQRERQQRQEQERRQQDNQQRQLEQQRQQQNQQRQQRQQEQQRQQQDQQRQQRQQEQQRQQDQQHERQQRDDHDRSQQRQEQERRRQDNQQREQDQKRQQDQQRERDRQDKQRERDERDRQQRQDKERRPQDQPPPADQRQPDKQRERERDQQRERERQDKPRDRDERDRQQRQDQDRQRPQDQPRDQRDRAPERQDRRDDEQRDQRDRREEQRERRDKSEKRDDRERRDGDQERRGKRLDDLRGERREFKEGERTIIREPGRTIVRENNRLTIRHNETDRFRIIGGRNTRTERRGKETVTIIDRPGGVKIVTVVDVNGRLIRRARRLANGREIIIIDNSFRPRPGVIVDYYVDVPPPVIRIPRERYIVEVEQASPELIYDTLIAPPVEPVTRRYSLDEIRYTPNLRALMPSVDIDTINFDFGSWEVTPDQAARLTEIARAINRALERNPSEVFLIEGHTDAVGSDIDNLSLSDRRAESVAIALTEQFQVPPENLTSQGYGEQQLKVQTDGPSRENRRVTVRRITPLLTGEGGERR